MTHLRQRMQEDVRLRNEAVTKLEFWIMNRGRASEIASCFSRDPGLAQRENYLLLIPQSVHRVDARGSSRGKVAGEEGDNG